MKEANPKLIGVFVIGGLALFVAALVFLSSRDLFTPKSIFVAYFQQSVNGLNVGAPIRFRGIPVGEVLQIDGVYDPDTGNIIPRLTLEFHPETLENAGVAEGEYTNSPAFLLSPTMPFLWMRKLRCKRPSGIHMNYAITRRAKR